MHHIIESDAQFRSTPLQFGGALLDNLFEAGGGILAFIKELIEGNCILAKYFNGARHFSNLVATIVLDVDIQVAARNTTHRAAK